MLIERFYDPDLAQASFVVACQAAGTALVIDPRRDIDVYLRFAADNGLQITDVTETHIHADYLSGARELAAATGARLRLSDEGGPDWLYRFDHEPLRHGSEFSLGNITVRAVHTPGHTPEHLSFLVTDGAASSEAGFLFTGDFVFAGDIGRPDLLDEAAGGEDTRFPMARTLFASLRDRFLNLPDWVRVFPGHGAGSACGKSLGAVDSTTVGYERLTAWWAPFVTAGDEEGFVNALLEGQPDAPLYFGRMKVSNRAGADLLGPLPAVPELAEVPATALLLDTRAREDFQAGHVPGSVHLPDGGSFVTWASWVLDPEQDLVVLARDADHAADLRARLSRVGLDRVTGFISSFSGLALEPFPLVQPGESGAASLIDVRTRQEHEAGSIPGASQLHGGRIMYNLAALPTDGQLVIHCQGGGRSAVVASALRARGFSNVADLAGGFDAWQEVNDVQSQLQHR